MPVEEPVPPAAEVLAAAAAVPEGTGVEATDVCESDTFVWVVVDVGALSG